VRRAACGVRRAWCDVLGARRRLIRIDTLAASALAEAEDCGCRATELGDFTPAVVTSGTPDLAPSLRAIQACPRRAHNDQTQTRILKGRLMNRNTLQGKKVAILVADGFEQVELTGPRQALHEAGAETRVVSPASGQVQGWKHFDKGEKFTVDVALDQANPQEFDALLLPGGVANPDQLRILPKAVDFIRHFFTEGKPVAAICHGLWPLIDAEVVRGRTITSWPSLRADLINAGARWVDQDVVVDNGLVSSRKPDDLPAFNRKMIEEIAEGKHHRQSAAASATSR
jgi:protease I